MRPRIASFLRHFGNLFFDTAERIHPIDNQPLSHRPGHYIVPTFEYHEGVLGVRFEYGEHSQN